MNLILQIFSFVFLGAVIILGFLHRPKEMFGCIVAASVCLVFLNIHEFSRFSVGGFEAVMRDRAVAVISKETEPFVQEAGSGVRIEAYGLVGDEAPKIIKALMNSKYTWRYANGISKESGVSIEKVSETLDWLKKNGLAEFSEDTTGGVWALTRKGRDAFVSLNK
jgi:hypothetical protein